ncbi:hexose kinase [Virgibacillus dakarensis]|nr:hexose kinase [Virgibacillus dakarensis]
MIYTITLNPAIDRLLYLERVMESRKTNRIIDVAYDIGGKGTHGSYTISKLGVDNVALGFMGDLNADKFQQVLTSKKITHDFCLVKGQATRECYIVIDRNTSGTTMLTEKGLTIPRHSVERFLDMLKTRVNSNDMVLIAGSLPTGFELPDLEKMITILKEAGCFIACDLSGETLKMAVELNVDFIKPNEFELTDLNEDGKDQIDFLRSLNNKIKYVVASLGEDGSYCIYNQEVYKVIPPKVKELNDTGAGDCFVGAFLAGVSKGYSIKETIRLASACAASKVTHSDSSTFDLEDIEKLKTQVEINRI